MKSQLTSPYHLQANGAVERFHRRLKDSLQARLAGSDWPSHLPWIMLGLRVAPRKVSGISAAELVYGCTLSHPSQFLSGAEPPPASFVRQLNSSLPCVASEPYEPAKDPASARRLQEATYVYVKAAPILPALSLAYRGPYRVLVPGRRYFVLEVGSRPQAFSVVNLKPHLGTAPVVLATAPSHGRPRCRRPPSQPLSPASRLGGRYCGGRAKRGSEFPINPPTAGKQICVTLIENIVSFSLTFEWFTCLNIYIISRNFIKNNWKPYDRRPCAWREVSLPTLLQRDIQ